jgi:hypothetical protein
MKKIRWKIIAAIFAAAAASVFAFTHGCARYAPVPPAPVLHTMLDINLITRAPLSDDFYYYIAMDASGSATTDGPHETLSGVDRAKNWTYYIVYHQGVFSELQLANQNDADALPTPFDNSSPRFYSATASSNSIHIVMYLDGLAPTARQVWFNFITSSYAINDQTQLNIYPVDYLTPPYFNMLSNRFPWQESSSTESQVSQFTPAGDVNKPADIYLWTSYIYQR